MTLVDVPVGTIFQLSGYEGRRYAIFQLNDLRDGDGYVTELHQTLGAVFRADLSIAVVDPERLRELLPRLGDPEHPWKGDHEKDQAR